MQEKLASKASKKFVAGKKGKKVQPSAGGGAAEAGDKYGNGVAVKGEEKGEELNREEEDEDERWAQEELELMVLAAIQEATTAKPVVDPDGKNRGRRFSGVEQCGEVDLHWQQTRFKKVFWDMGGRVEAILARQRALLRWVASGFQGKFEQARGFSPEDENKWLRLEASLVCDQRAWKKFKRSSAVKEAKSG
jgi:hypothetical protein